MNLSMLRQRSDDLRIAVPLEFIDRIPCRIMQQFVREANRLKSFSKKQKHISKLPI